MSNQLVFNSTNLTVINHNNQIWFTSTELAKALEYKRSDSVSRIYSRNQDEFASCMTETVNLTLSGNLTKSIRIFSLRGAHLIAMFANTDVAKDFRRWVLDILDREVDNNLTITRVKPEMVSVNKSYLGNLIYNAIWIKEFYYANKLYEIFTMLNSDFGSRMHNHIQDVYIDASYLKSCLKDKIS